MSIKSTIMISLVASLGLANLSYAAEDAPDGKKLAYNGKKGNCIACHAIPSDKKVEAAGNIGTPLQNMKDRYPDRAKLRAQIWDATVINHDSLMPPFGRNKIMTEQEIDLVTDYILTL